MKHAVVCSKKLAIAGGCFVVVTLAAAYSLDVQGRSINTAAKNAQIERSALVAELAALSDCTPESLLALRKQVIRQRDHLGSGVLEEAQTALGKRWQLQLAATEKRPTYTMQYANFAARITTADWTLVIDAVSSLENIRGLRLCRLEVRTEGDRAERRRADAKICVVAATQNEPGTETSQ